MKTRKLRDIEVSAIGMGCMGFTHGYGAAPSEGESIKLMRKAFDLGCTLYDTAEVYSAYANEELVGKALKPIRDKVALSSKVHPAFLPGQEIPEGKLSRRGGYGRLWKARCAACKPTGSTCTTCTAFQMEPTWRRLLKSSRSSQKRGKSSLGGFRRRRRSRYAKPTRHSRSRRSKANIR